MKEKKTESLDTLASALTANTEAEAIENSIPAYELALSEDAETAKQLTALQLAEASDEAVRKEWETAHDGYDAYGQSYGDVAKDDEAMYSQPHTDIDGEKGDDYEL